MAYVVCRAMGLETTARSSDYIQLHQGDVATLSDSLDCIQKTAASLIERLRDDSDHIEKEGQHHASVAH